MGGCKHNPPLTATDKIHLGVGQVEFDKAGALRRPPVGVYSRAMAQGDWLVAYTFAHREKALISSLDDAGVAVWCPFSVARMHRRLRGGRHVLVVEERPLFPRYAFVQTEDVAWLRGAREIHSLLAVAGELVRIPDERFVRLKALCTAENGSFLRVGDQFTICSGPFVGESAIILSTNQLRRGEVDVWISVLGSRHKARLPVDAIGEITRPAASVRSGSDGGHPRVVGVRA